MHTGFEDYRTLTYLVHFMKTTNAKLAINASLLTASKTIDLHTSRSF
jgi:hypothetical protein